MTAAGSTSQGLLIVEGRPEALFRVARPSEDGVVVRSSMSPGPWLSGPDGRAPAGVLIDNVLGYAIMLRRPPGRWSVSAEISLDMFVPGPWGESRDGSPELSAEARNDYCDETGGIASGWVSDSSGRLIARCRQHGRWVRTVPDSHPAGTRVTAESWAPPRPAGLAQLLGVPAVAGDAASLELAVTGDLANPLANLHGGITLCACELVARAAVGTAGGPWHTASIHVTYPRPVPVGSVARFEGRVLHRGRAFAVVQVIAWNASGRPCVIATVTVGAPGRG
jgi:uncharacterized protein (TIGR00369 family)